MSMLLLLLLHGLTCFQEASTMRFGATLEGAWVVSEVIDGKADDVDGIGMNLLILDKYIFIFRPLQGAEVGCFSLSQIKNSTIADERIELEAYTIHDFFGRRQTFRVFVVASQLRRTLREVEPVFQSLEITFKGKIVIEELSEDTALHLKCKKLDVDDGRLRISKFVSALKNPFIGLDAEAKIALRIWLHLD